LKPHGSRILEECAFVLAAFIDACARRESEGHMNERVTLPCTLYG
jgi:hypothetical protein